MLKINHKNITLLGLGIFFITSSFLIFEISLIRIFSVMFFPSISFFAISTALFGVSLGGLIVYIFPNSFRVENLNKNILRYTVLYSLSIFLFIIYVASATFTNKDLATINNIIFSNKGFLNITMMFIMSSLPFVYANIILTLIFKFNSSGIGKLYFFDLIGASFGVVISLIMLGILKPISILFIVIIFSLISAIFLNYHKRVIILSLLLTAILTGGIIINEKNDFITIKSLLNKFQKDSTEIIFSKWNSFSHVSVDSGPQGSTDSLSESLNLKVPMRWAIRIDGSAYTEIYNINENLDNAKFLENDLSIIGFKLSDPGNALVIGAGGGRDVLMGLISGHHVTGVEINPIIVNDVMKGIAKDFSGNIYNNKNVEIVIAEGRSFINKSEKSYSIISIPLVDTWASSISGSLALVESNLYTVEAMQDYLNHLEEGGILNIVRWNFDGMRLISLFLEASEILEIELPKNNIAILRKDILDNYVFKKSPLTNEEKEKIQEFATQNEFEIVYLPGSDIKNSYNEYLNTNDKEYFLGSHDKNISPVYDNKPFFFFTPKINILKISQYNFLDGGLFITFIIVLFSTLFLIIFPTFLQVVKNIKNLSLKISLPYIGYFLSIGLGFILIEISLIQKFILYLSYPIYSYSVTLINVLLFAGMGSLISKNFKVSKKVFATLGLAITTTTIATTYVISYIIKHTITLDIIIKILITSAVLIPLSLLMGMMLPLGIKRLGVKKLDVIIPWSWAVNGAASVFGSVLAIILAISFGFTTVLIIGSVIYLIAVLFIYMTK